jgi:anti-sigma-K factor RskA
MGAAVSYQIIIRVDMRLTLHQPTIRHFDNSFSSAEAAAARVVGLVVAATAVTAVVLIIIL